MTLTVESFRTSQYIRLFCFTMKGLSIEISRTFYLFTPTRLINSIKHEHSCKILYLFTGRSDDRFRYQILTPAVNSTAVPLLFVL